VERLQDILNTSVDEKKIFGTSFAIKKGDFVWYGSSGNMSNDQPYFIASTTKLFTTALILHLRSEQKLSLDDTINTYLDDSILK
jgi:CubicO group peptidase (beta-lactamase class C family)